MPVEPLPLAGGEGTWGLLVDIINPSFETGVFVEGLEEVMVVPFLKKSTLDPHRGSLQTAKSRLVGAAIGYI